MSILTLLTVYFKMVRMVNFMFYNTTKKKKTIPRYNGTLLERLMGGPDKAHLQLSLNILKT